MNSEEIEYFLNKYVTLVLINNNFRLNGCIKRVTYDAIVFETDQKTSLINIDQIQQILVDRNG